MRSCRKSVSSRYRPAGTIAGRWRRGYREWLEKWRQESRGLAEADRRRHADWLVEWRAQAKEQKLRLDAIDAAMENDKRVTREIVLEMQEARERDREFYADLRDEMRAQRDGLLRILDEMRRNDGPSPAGA